MKSENQSQLFDDELCLFWRASAETNSQNELTVALQELGKVEPPEALLSRLKQIDQSKVPSILQKTGNMIFCRTAVAAICCSLLVLSLFVGQIQQFKDKRLSFARLTDAEIQESLAELVDDLVLEDAANDFEADFDSFLEVL